MAHTIGSCILIRVAVSHTQKPKDSIKPLALFILNLLVMMIFLILESSIHKNKESTILMFFNKLYVVYSQIPYCINKSTTFLSLLTGTQITRQTIPFNLSLS